MAKETHITTAQPFKCDRCGKPAERPLCPECVPGFVRDQQRKAQQQRDNWEASSRAAQSILADRSARR